MKTQSIKKNYILNTAYQVLTLITPLITAPYISRILGPERVGIYSYTASVVGIFYNVCSDWEQQLTDSEL